MIHLFHPSHGLLQFIEKTLGDKDFKGAQIKSLGILEVVVNNCLSDISNKNVVCIYSLATKIIKSNVHYLVKTRLFDLLMLCFEKIDRCMENNDSVLICKDLINSLRIALTQKHTETGKCRKC